MTTLAGFLLARIAEDEGLARTFVECDWAGVDSWGDGGDIFYDGGAASISRVLAECEAKRRIVAEHRDGKWPHPADPCDAHGHEVVPVETGGEIVARLCVTCDKQLAP